MRFLEILVEGKSDVPIVAEILRRKFNLRVNDHFRIHPHQGKGTLPASSLARPELKHRGLLDQLPAKLRGYAKSLPSDYGVVVLLDADDDDCTALKARLVDLHQSLDLKPAIVLFRIAVEEVESWYLADADAIKSAYPHAKLAKLPDSPPDIVIGAWEHLAAVLGRKGESCTGADKFEWAEKIAPHLDLDHPQSPSLRMFIEGLARHVPDVP